MKIKLSFLLFCLFPLLLAAEQCSVCNKKIQGKFIRTKQGDYCSKQCYHSTQPECENCKNRCLQGSVAMLGKNFCSKRCMHKFFKCAVCGTGLDRVVSVTNSFEQKIYCCPSCSKKPSCYFCSMPTDRAALKDGRVICRQCRSQAVTDSSDIRRIFRDLREDLAKYYNFNKTHHIELVIVDQKRLKKESEKIYTPNGARNMALMRYQKKTVTKRFPDGRVKRVVVDEKCRIYVLHTVPLDLLIDSLVHELTHDHLRHKVGEVMDLASEEGFCELVASLYNEKRGKKYINLGKEKNLDPIYGGGFRKMRDIYRRTRNLKKTMEQVK